MIDHGWILGASPLSSIDTDVVSGFKLEDDLEDVDKGENTLSFITATA